MMYLDTDLFFVFLSQEHDMFLKSNEVVFFFSVLQEFQSLSLQVFYLSYSFYFLLLEILLDINEVIFFYPP